MSPLLVPWRRTVEAFVIRLLVIMNSQKMLRPYTQFTLCCAGVMEPIPLKSTRSLAATGLEWNWQEIAKF